VRVGVVMALSICAILETVQALPCNVLILKERRLLVSIYEVWWIC
jgi:hypothetical protein